MSNVEAASVIIGVMEGAHCHEIHNYHQQARQSLYAIMRREENRCEYDRQLPSSITLDICIVDLSITTTNKATKKQRYMNMITNTKGIYQNKRCSCEQCVELEAKLGDIEGTSCSSTQLSMTNMPQFCNCHYFAFECFQSNQIHETQTHRPPSPEHRKMFIELQKVREAALEEIDQTNSKNFKQKRMHKVLRDCYSESCSRK